MIDPTYTTQALAWLVVWSAGGLAGRQWLAGREAERRRRAAGTKTRSGSRVR